MRAWSPVALALAAAAAVPVPLLACDDPGARVTIADARASRDRARHVVVEVDVLGHEALGGNIGTYCTRVTFPGQALPREECRHDLEDGDTATIRIVSDGDLDPGAQIAIRVRLGVVDEGRSLAAPAR